MKLKLLAILITTVFISSCWDNSSKEEAFDTTTISEDPTFEIKTTEGSIFVKLYNDTPLHKANFIKLASEKFYDDILFHRVIKGFMIQVGDPLTKDPTAQESMYGTGGPGYTIKAEIDSTHNHKKGALAAARRGGAANPEKRSSGSQFYIVESPEGCSQLDGDYTVFGETIEGFDVIDKIAATKTAVRDRPVKDIKIISILPIKQTPKKTRK